MLELGKETEISRLDGFNGKEEFQFFVFLLFVSGLSIWVELS